MSLFNSGIDLYSLYTIVRRLSMPFEEWKAFRVGLIDKDGNFLVKKSNRSPEQEKSMTYLDIFILNLKKIIRKVPGANNKWLTYAGALYLLRESEDNLKSLINEEGEMVGNFANNSSQNIARSSEGEAKAFSHAKKILKRRKNLTPTK